MTKVVGLVLLSQKNEVVSLTLILLMYLLDMYICSLGKTCAIFNFDNVLLIY